MIMTDGEIEEAIKSKKLIIEKFNINNLQPASYDVRLGDEVLLSGEDNVVNLKENQTIRINPGQFALLVTKELFRMPNNMVGVIGSKGDVTRKGLIILSGLQIDPTFEGNLCIGVYNASPRKIVLDYLDSFVTVEFHKLAKPAERQHRGIPELTRGKIPDEAKDYLRHIETSSLSELSESVRTLSMNMNTLTTVTYKMILPILVTIFGGVIVSILIQLILK